MLLGAGILSSNLPEARAQVTGTLTTLYNFVSSSAGNARLAGLVQGSNGNFYGTGVFQAAPI